MGVARAWSRSEMRKFLPSLSVNFIIYLQNVWSAMSLSLLVPEEKKLSISINFQKSVYPLYVYISHKTKGCDIWPPLKSQLEAVFDWEHCVIFILVASCINNIHQVPTFHKNPKSKQNNENY